MSFDKAAALIQQAKHIVALTGAGISTPSGIPDFRSADSGLWEKHNPMEVASLSSFRTRPERFYDWIHPLMDDIDKAQPNPAHTALAQLEETGRLNAIITQNIDGLHQKAGSKTVYEIHGSLNTLSCQRCDKQYPAEGFIEPFVTDKIYPQCPNCGKILKPDVILFEEMLPMDIWEKAYQEMLACDLMIVAGSSLEVTPVCDLPAEAKSHGANIIVINKSPTYIDSKAEVVLNNDVAVALPEIVNYV